MSPRQPPSLTGPVLRLSALIYSPAPLVITLFTPLLAVLVLAIALVAAGESVNESMVTRTLELLLVYGGKSVNEMVRQFSGRES